MKYAIWPGPCAWLCIAAMTLQSCKKDMDPGANPLADLGGEKAFSICNLPNGAIISVAAFGAIPNDGIDDTEAFILASQAVEAQCNALTRTFLDIPSGTYDVGRQLTQGQTWTVGTDVFTNPAGSSFSHLGINIITINCCPNVMIRGTGVGVARLRFHDGMSYGWNGGCGGTRASVGTMISLEGTKCASVVNLELDGNNENCNLLPPCPAQDHYQIAYDGLLAHSSTYLDISKLHTHHHGRDGLMLYKRVIAGCTYSTNMQNIHLTGVISEHNSRQGFTWADGTDLVANSCAFNHTGSVFYNNPGAGLDIEPDNGGIAARGIFNKCKFEQNRVWGVICDNKPTTVWDVAFNDCSIWHKNSGGAAIWLTRGNQFQFNKSKIYGTILHGAGYTSTQRAVFAGCSISDIGPDALPCSLTQNILLHQGPGDSFFEFDGCNFDLHNNRLAFVQSINAPPPYTARRFVRNVFRFNYPSLSCGGNSNIHTVFCGGANECSNMRLIGYFRNTDWADNRLIDSNPLAAAEPANKNYLIQIGNNAGPNSFRNTMNGGNTFQFVAGSNVGHFLRQYDPANGCWGNRNNF